MAEGLTRHQAGQWEQAETLYRRVLGRDPAHGQALYLLGSVLAQQQCTAEAVEWLGKALTVTPDHPQALSHRGVALKELGRLDDALADYDAALRLRPCYPEALNNRGVALQALGRAEEAIADFQMAAAQRPGYTEALNNLGVACRKAGRWDDARDAFGQVLARDPLSRAAGNNLGLVLLEQGDLAGALARFEAALDTDSSCVPAINNKGLALKEMGRLGDASACFHEALARDPGFTEAQVNLGTCLLAANRMEDALAATDLALKQDPAHAGAHWNRALILLTLGDWARGWPEYEWRFASRMVAPRAHAAPPWDGTPLAGRTLLVRAEQGAGDTLQFVRCCAAIETQGGEVVLECPPAVHRIVQSCMGVDRVVPHAGPGEADTACDVQVSLLSLPGLLGIMPQAEDTPCLHVRYLHAPPAQAARWRAALDALSPGGGKPGPLRVGLVWAGNPGHKNDRSRSCRLADWDVLGAVPNVALYSLQKGPAEAQIGGVPPAWRPVPLGPLLEDFADTAAAMQALDLVIAVDTSSAHLAGALGVPVWTLLPFSPDWRWMLGREDTPWYPGMRLFRQSAPGDWPAVLARVAQQLAVLADAHAHLAHTLDDWEHAPPPDLKPRLHALARMFPRTARVWNDLGVRCWQDGEPADALRMFLRALQCDPADETTRLNCADVFAACGRHDDAAALRADGRACKEEHGKKADGKKAA